MGKHAGTNWKIRVINNYKSNKVNEYAWIPSKIRYDNLSELMEAARTIKQYSDGKLTLGKADFKSASKRYLQVVTSRGLTGAWSITPH